jgi:hypothetical protein
MIGVRSYPLQHKQFPYASKNGSAARNRSRESAQELLKAKKKEGNKSCPIGIDGHFVILEAGNQGDIKAQ